MTSTQKPTAAPAVTTWPTTGRWTAACVLGETIGMTAAAAAGVTAQHLDARGWSAVLSVGIVVLGGIVEGVALGGLQARALRNAPGARPRRWFLATVVVAGIGWAAASTPQALSDDSGSGSPPLLLVLAGAAALGAVMGALLGAAQAATFVPSLHHRWRWVGISALAWTPAMAVIFLGASVPGSGWKAPVVIALGPLTGAAAGWVLGRSSGWLIPSLAGARPHDLFVLRMLHSAWMPLLGDRLLGLRFPGAVTGRTIELPVMYAVEGPRLVVMPGHPEAKRWWHNLEGTLTEVEVLHRRHWSSAVAEVLTPGTSSYDRVRAAYLRRWPHVEPADDQPFVLLYGLRG
jgi:hypothetical protein